MGKRNAIISGGAGFIGSHLAKELIKRNFNKVYLVDNLIRSNNLRNLPKDDREKILKEYK